MEMKNPTVRKTKKPILNSLALPASIEKGLYWVLTEGAAGMKNQGLGLAEAMGASRIEHHQIKLTKLWHHLAPYLRWNWRDDQRQFQPPWPEVVVACGRKAILPALWLKKNMGIPVVYVQDPYISPRHFDVVVAPTHDGMRSHEKVIPMLGACHRISEGSLQQARADFADTLGSAPQPRRSLFIGGPNGCFSMPLLLIQSLIHDVQKEEGTLWVTVSRRTPADIVNMLRQQKNMNLITPGDTPNPYMGLLAWSDVCLLTCDSVSMASEVMAAGVPLYLVRLPGYGRRIARFHEDVESRGLIRWWNPAVPSVPYPTTPLREMDRVAACVKERLAKIESMT